MPTGKDVTVPPKGAVARSSFAIALVCALIGAAGVGAIAATSRDNPFAALLLFAYALGCVPGLVMLYFGSFTRPKSDRATPDEPSESP